MALLEDIAFGVSEAAAAAPEMKAFAEQQQALKVKRQREEEAYQRLQEELKNNATAMKRFDEQVLNSGLLTEAEKAMWLRHGETKDFNKYLNNNYTLFAMGSKRKAEEDARLRTQKEETAAVSAFGGIVEKVPGKPHRGKVTKALVTDPTGQTAARSKTVQSLLGKLESEPSPLLGLRAAKLKKEIEFNFDNTLKDAKKAAANLVKSADPKLKAQGDAEMKAVQLMGKFRKEIDSEEQFNKKLNEIVAESVAKLPKERKKEPAPPREKAPFDGSKWVGAQQKIENERIASAIGDKKKSGQIILAKKRLQILKKLAENPPKTEAEALRELAKVEFIKLGE